MDVDTRKGLIFIGVSTFGYALIPIFTKFIYQWSDLAPLDLVVWRFILAIPLMWGFALFWQQQTSVIPPRGTLPRGQLLLTGLALGGAGLAVVSALPYIDAGVYVVLFFTYPAMTGILAALLGEPLPWRGWLALALTTVGVILTTPEIFSGGLADSQLLGVGLSLVNALAVAVYMVWIGRVTRGYPPTPWSTVWSVTGTVLLLAPLVLITGIATPGTVRVWLLFVGMSLLGTVVPVFGLTMGIRMLGASRAAIVGTLEPVLVIVLAYGLLGERMLAIQLLGAALILASIVILESRPTRRPRHNIRPYTPGDTRS